MRSRQRHLGVLAVCATTLTSCCRPTQCCTARDTGSAEVTQARTALATGSHSGPRPSPAGSARTQRIVALGSFDLKITDADFRRDRLAALLSVIGAVPTATGWDIASVSVDVERSPESAFVTVRPKPGTGWQFNWCLLIKQYVRSGLRIDGVPSGGTDGGVAYARIVERDSSSRREVTDRLVLSLAAAGYRSVDRTVPPYLVVRSGDGGSPEFWIDSEGSRGVDVAVVARELRMQAVAEQVVLSALKEVVPSWSGTYDRCESEFR